MTVLKCILTSLFCFLLCKQTIRKDTAQIQTDVVIDIPDLHRGDYYLKVKEYLKGSSNVNERISKICSKLIFEISYFKLNSKHKP